MPYDFIHTKFKNRQNSSLVIEMRREAIFQGCCNWKNMQRGLRSAGNDLCLDGVVTRARPLYVISWTLTYDICISSVPSTKIHLERKKLVMWRESWWRPACGRREYLPESAEAGPQLPLPASALCPCRGACIPRQQPHPSGRPWMWLRFYFSIFWPPAVDLPEILRLTQYGSAAIPISTSVIFLELV